MTRPTGLLYAVDEPPPPAILVVSALQHVAVVVPSLTYPIIVAREAGLSGAQLIDFISLSLLALGLATILLCMRSRLTGSGYLCPAGYTQIYLGPSLFALHSGGLPLVFGMTAIAGLMQFAVSLILRRLRALLPTEIAGLVIAIVGLSLAVVGVRLMLGVIDGQRVQPVYLPIACVTLVTMIVLNIWTRGYPRLFCVLIGMAAGYAVSAVSGVLDVSAAIPAGGLSVVHLPEPGMTGWRIDPGLLAPFVIAAIAATLRIMGDISNAQRLNDADWTRPHFRSLTGGVAANGLANLVAGIVGCCGLNTYSSSIGLAGATGVTSRRIGYVIGIIFAVLSLVPMAAVVLAAMPPPVMGASMFFSSAFVFTSGLQMITSRLLDARKSLVIGLSFSMAVVADVIHDVFATLPVALQPIFGSSLVLGTLCAVSLNLVLRIGIRQRVSITLDPGHINREAVEQFLSENGASWAARRDVINRAIFGAVQTLEVLGAPADGVEIEASFDEFNLDLRIRYAGAVLSIPERRPTARQIASDAGEQLLAGYLLRRTADRIACRASGKQAEILLHYDH